MTEPYASHDASEIELWHPTLDHDLTLPQYWSEHPPKRKGFWGKLQRFLLQVHYLPSHLP